MSAQHQATHYRWADLPRDQPMVKLARRRVVGRQAMIAEITMQRGCRVPVHAHHNEQFACVISGEVLFELGDARDGTSLREITLGPGEVIHLPSQVPHGAVALVDSVVLDIFSPPSEQTGIDRA